jgi:predicted Zn-dependent protease
LKSLAVVIVVGAGFNLLPFQSDGAASDGLGILSSPFLPDEAIEMRLMTAQSREIGRMQDAGLHAEAKAEILRLQQRFPGNHWLQRRFGAALAASGSVDEARDYVRDKLDATDLDDGERRQWLKLQAEIELDAGQPAYLVLDLALQKALAITADAPDLLAIRGASLVERGKYADGGNILAHAWRSNDGTADDAMMLAYLAMAAAGVGDRAAGARFRDAFERTSRSAALRQKLDARTS